MVCVAHRLPLRAPASLSRLGTFGGEASGSAPLSVWAWGLWLGVRSIPSLCPLVEVRTSGQGTLSGRETQGASSPPALSCSVSLHRPSVSPPLSSFPPVTPPDPSPSLPSGPHLAEGSAEEKAGQFTPPLKEKPAFAAVAGFSFGSWKPPLSLVCFSCVSGMGRLVCGPGGRFLGGRWGLGQEWPAASEVPARVTRTGDSGAVWNSAEPDDRDEAGSPGAQGLGVHGSQVGLDAPGGWGSEVVKHTSRRHEGVSALVFVLGSEDWGCRVQPQKQSLCIERL